MKVIKLQQNSDEWLEFRKGKSGGSEFKNLWIPGLPLKAKIIERLERENPLSPEDKSKQSWTHQSVELSRKAVSCCRICC